MEKLLVGVGRQVITPPLGTMLQGYTPARPALAVHDDVRVTAFAFETAGQRALLFSAEMCNIRVDIIQKIKAALVTQTGVPASNMIIACTHTHSSAHATWGADKPHNFITDIFIPKACQAAAEALASLQPAQMGVGTVHSQVAVNRRQIKEETGMAVLGQNPYGSFDPAMTVVAFRGLDGTPIGNLIHYGCHNTASGKNDEVTRDWAGVMVDRLEERSGGITAFINGCAGDCGPRLPNGKTTGDVKMAMELGEKAGRDAIAAWQGIETWENAPLTVLQAPISLPLQDVGTAEDVMKQAAALGDPAELKGTMLSSYNHLVERAQYLRAGNVPPKEQAIEHTFFVLGELVMQAIPFEPFSLLTLRIKDGSPFRHTLCVGYANGSLSYFPSMDQLIRGGYEVRMFRTINLIPFADDSEQHYVTGSLQHIRSLYERSQSDDR